MLDHSGKGHLNPTELHIALRDLDIPVTQEVGVKTTKTRPDDNDPRRNCVHDDNGVCTLHGGGAERLFKPVVTTRRGRSGKVVRTVKKTFYYECRVGPGGGILRQATLGFARAGPERNTIETIQNSNKNSDDFRGAMG